MANRLDHGVLNVPLSKRGNIDKELDKFKAKQAREEKKARKTRSKEIQGAKKERREARAEAKAMLSKFPNSYFKEIGAAKGLTAAQAKAELKNYADLNPITARKAFANSLNRLNSVSLEAPRAAAVNAGNMSGSSRPRRAAK